MLQLSDIFTTIGSTYCKSEQYRTCRIIASYSPISHVLKIFNHRRMLQHHEINNNYTLLFVRSKTARLNTGLLQCQFILITHMLKIIKHTNTCWESIRSKKYIRDISTSENLLVKKPLDCGKVDSRYMKWCPNISDQIMHLDFTRPKGFELFSLQFAIKTRF